MNTHSSNENTHAQECLNGIAICSTKTYVFLTNNKGTGVGYYIKREQSSYKAGEKVVQKARNLYEVPPCTKYRLTVN